MASFSHPRAFALAVAVGSTLAACGGPPAPPPMAPPAVTVATLATERVVLTTELPGRTAPYRVAEVRPQVNGLLQERRFTEGGDVRAGDLLYQIDSGPYRTAYEQAQAALGMAEASLPAARLRAERLRGLAADNVVGAQDADDAEAALHAAEASVAAGKAAVEAARIQLGYTPIRAPIGGRTGRSMLTVGALVTAYQPVPLVTITQLDPIYVDVAQSSAEILRLRRVLSSGSLRPGETARQVKLRLEDGTDYALTGTLEFQEATVDPMTGAVTLRLVFPNPDHLLLPGMYVRAIIEEGVDEAAVLAPQQGVTRDPRGTAYGLVVGADGKVEQRELAIARALGDRWLVTSGLTAGDRLIVEGVDRVRPGMDVTPVEAGAPPPGSGPPPAAGN